MFVAACAGEPSAQYAAPTLAVRSQPRALEYRVPALVAIAVELDACLFFIENFSVPRH
jgi:hypothetical protein